MRPTPILLALALALARPALADVARALDAVILPGVAAFETAAAALAEGAARDCRAEAVRPLYAAARDAWARIGDVRLGPGEAAALTVAFWPDDRASGLRALRARLAAPDPAPADAAAAAALPASARGFSGLDLMLGEPGLAYDADAPGCALVRALAADLAAQAAALGAAWAAHAALLRAPGTPATPGALAYLDEAEALRALYTQALAGLEFTLDGRLGRPLGSFERPRPARAEAWRTGRSLPNALGAARAAHALAAALADRPTPRADAALAAVEAAAAAIADPGFQDVTDPRARLRLEALRQRMADLRAAISTEVGAALGLAPGFNALDGD